MHIPELYKNEDPEDIARFIGQNGFATLVTAHNGNPWATHLPLMMRTIGTKQFLHGHISAENPQSRWLESGEVLAIFLGPDAYISSSWYDHENVPTWNYISVHIYGKVRVFDWDETLEHLSELTRHYEKDSKNPVSVEALSQKTMLQARGVTAFEIEITAVHANRKLSQNRDAKNHAAIVAELEMRSNGRDCEIAREMKKG